ncbi:MAG: selenocysteine-specific translation elongation factor [Acidobacteriota bacterium]
MRTVVIGTAGHVDHGKSALVKALTGTDPDRLKEERQRGITIDLGFAHLPTDGQPTLSFVDVPGHERFVKNMLAGASGLDLLVLVVAADESVMPQTREHLDICQLLGLERGLIVLSKSDLADDETRELCRLEITELVEGTFLEGAPVLECSAITGDGLDELRQTLHSAAAEAPERGAEGVFRMPVDRVFTLKGFGTVVTGTAQAGSLDLGDDVELLPGRLGARVRGVQVHGEVAETGRAGQRVALNLGGVGHDELQRGVVVTRPDALPTTSLLDVIVELLPDAPELDDLARVRLHLGTAEVLARARWAQGRPPAPGEAALAQLRLESPVVAAVADRFVIRRYSPLTTIGGGRVLDAAPTVKIRRKDEDRPVELERLRQALADGDQPALLTILVETRGADGLAVDDLAALLGLRRAVVDERLTAVPEDRLVRIAAGGGRLVAPRYVEEGARLIRETLTAFHAAEALQAGLSKPELRDRCRLGEELFVHLLQLGQETEELTVSKQVVALAGHEVKLTPEQEAASRHLLEAHLDAGLKPPDLTAVLASCGLDDVAARRVLHLLFESGELVRLKGDMALSGAALAALLADMASWYQSGEEFSVPDFKDRSGVSRKHAIPLLEHLDGLGVTRRSGDGRAWLGRPEDR